MKGAKRKALAAQNDIEAGKRFNPACDPTSAHAGDRQHTTFYCNGWTDGYISAWNDKHKQSSTGNVGSGISHPVSTSNSTTNQKKVLPTLALICKNKSGNNLICTYTNRT